MKRQRGFTLVELLVAIGVLAIVAVLGWRGLDTIVRTRLSLNNELEQTRGQQLAFAQMQSDCAKIASPASVPNRPILAAEPGSLFMVRYVFAENQPTQVQVVSYRIRDDKLIRRESFPTRDLTELDASWRAAVSDQETVPAVTLQSGVSNLLVRWWDNTNTAWVDPPFALGSATQLAGLKATLRVSGSPTDLVKIFLLGAT